MRPKARMKESIEYFESVKIWFEKGRETLDTESGFGKLTFSLHTFY